MKTTLIIFIALTALIALASCSQEQNYSIHVTSSNSCFVELSLFNVNGIQIGHDDYDCKETLFCIFKVPAMGTYILHADNGKKQQKTNISVHQQITEVAIDL
jgi:hypothetical protein